MRQYFYLAAELCFRCLAMILTCVCYISQIKHILEIYIRVIHGNKYLTKKKMFSMAVFYWVLLLFLWQRFFYPSSGNGFGFSIRGNFFFRFLKLCLCVCQGWDCSATGVVENYDF